jgi:hypothetical protein
MMLVARIDHALTRGINWLTTSLVERARGFNASESGDFLDEPDWRGKVVRFHDRVIAEVKAEEEARQKLVEREAEEEVAEPSYIDSPHDWRHIVGGPPAHWKVGDSYCGQCGANITAVDFHACPQSPAASAGRGESSSSEVSAGPSPTAPSEGRAWIDWAVPAICDVLASHRPEVDRLGRIVCHSASGGSLACFGDWQEWREHVAPLIAERLDLASKARFCIDGGEPQTVVLNAIEYERYLDGWLNPGREQQLRNTK